MLRYELRTLMITLALAPPLLAWGWSAYIRYSERPRYVNISGAVNISGNTGADPVPFTETRLRPKK